MSIRTLVLALVASLLGGGLSAQDGRTLAPGDRARIELAGASQSGAAMPWIAGTVRTATADSLWLRLTPGDTEAGYGAPDLQRLQVKVRRSGVQGALLGGAIGAAVGGLVGLVIPNLFQESGSPDVPASDYLLLGGGGAAAGATIGLIWGSIRPGRHWVDARLPG